MKVEQFVPGSAESSEPQTASVSSLEELQELPWIKLFARRDRKFYRFTLNRVDEQSIFILIAESEREERRVMAFVSGEDAEDIMNQLPVWTHSSVLSPK